MAGHDISDGGLITCLLEMAFSGISGLNLEINHKKGTVLEILFAEEVGWILEVDSKFRDYVLSSFKGVSVPCHYIGDSVGYGVDSQVRLCNINVYIHPVSLSLSRTLTIDQ